MDIQRTGQIRPTGPIVHSNTEQYYRESTSDSRSMTIFVRESGPDSPLIIKTTSIEEIRNKLLSLYEEYVSILIDTIKTQKERLEYNGYYIAYLLDQISDEEFEEISEQYAFDVNNGHDINEVSRKIAFLIKMTNISFSTQELSDIFKCQDNVIDLAIEKLKEQNIFLISEG